MGNIWENLQFEKRDVCVTVENVINFKPNNNYYDAPVLAACLQQLL